MGPDQSPSRNSDKTLGTVQQRWRHFFVFGQG